jgi:hypothetical protein
MALVTVPERPRKSKRRYALMVGAASTRRTALVPLPADGELALTHVSAMGLRVADVAA